MSAARSPKVALFVTCLVDMFRPNVGFAAVKLMEEAGCIVEVPTGQTCCGQPAFNSGDRATAKAIGSNILDVFEPYEYVVAPSGSCAGMLKTHLPELFAADPGLAKRALAFSAKTFELVSFLTDVLGIASVNASLNATATYHDSCSGLRELGIKRQPRALLQTVEGLTLKEMAESEVCCGFGGTFCVKYSDISNKIVEKKTADIAATGADLLLAGDMGCLMNMAGKLQRDGHGDRIKVRHVAEVLAGLTDEPPIGDAADKA